MSVIRVAMSSNLKLQWRQVYMSVVPVNVPIKGTLASHRMNPAVM